VGRLEGVVGSLEGGFVCMRDIAILTKYGGKIKHILVGAEIFHVLLSTGTGSEI
jgi:hypothetical protein